MKINDSLPLKIALMGVLALLMLVPLAMIQGQIRDRQEAAKASRSDVAASWGRAQTLAGPVLDFYYETEEMEDGQKTTRNSMWAVYPRTLSYDLDLQTQTLHRSIYDVMVYGADVVVTGDFVIPASLGEKKIVGQEVMAWLSDLRGIEGAVEIKLGEETLSFHTTVAGMEG